MKKVIIKKGDFSFSLCKECQLNCNLLLNLNNETLLEYLNNNLEKIKFDDNDIIEINFFIDDDENDNEIDNEKN